ncbi:MAG: dihydroneopterin aldolase [Candidatus Zixiibacteriota bacterium]
MTDVIRLVGMLFYAYHGVSKAERETGRQYEVDCEMVTDLAPAGKSDRLNSTIDYAKIYTLIERIMKGKGSLLIERLATKMADAILTKCKADAVTIRVRKLAPPIDGMVKHVEVEITRSRIRLSKSR